MKYKNNFTKLSREKNICHPEFISESRKGRRVAFTLAEVLITLAIIGVVAAMTIPTLIAKINKIVTDNQTKVFKAKIIKGLNLTKTSGDLNDTYETTYDFLVNGLGKNLKMAKICDSEHISDCVPYNKISYLKNENEEKTINVSELTASKLKLDDRQFKDIAAFVLADGTPAIVSYNLKCIDDPDKADTEINACLSGIYDLNGTRKPNKMGKDLMTFNGAGMDGAILASVGGVKIITNAQKPTPLKTGEYCDTTDSNNTKWTVKSEYSSIIKHCCTLDDCIEGNGDYWAGAAIACKNAGGKLPSDVELKNMANALYPGMNATEGTSYTYGTGNIGTGSTPIPDALSGIGSSWNIIWSSNGFNSDGAYIREFSSSKTRKFGYHRDHRNRSVRMICVQ